jgi:ADP-ribose pyrophosphatase YjhB (NUDIX family)
MTPADEAVDLRRGIDHIGVGVCCIVHDGRGNFLMMKRGEQARDERGSWDIVGGAIEFGESIDDALKRELMEEICAVPIQIEFIGAYDAHREHDGDKTHWVQMLHAVQVDPNQVKIGEPHKIAEIGWFNSTNLPEPRHSQFNKSFDVAVERGLIS